MKAMYALSQTLLYILYICMIPLSIYLSVQCKHLRYLSSNLARILMKFSSIRDDDDDNRSY